MTNRKPDTPWREPFHAAFGNGGKLVIRGLRGLSIVAVLWCANATAAAPIEFHRDVRPILSNHCFPCHGPDHETRQAELRLDKREGIFGAASNGASIVAPGNLQKSELYRRVTCASPEERMPPEEHHKPLSVRHVELLRNWIEQGASWQGHWAYSVPSRPELPVVGLESVTMNPVDRLILARLEREGLSPSPPADPVTLARRVAFDLTGLPPDQAEVEAFTANPSDERYGQMVDRLLASPHYGERMAVHWLDLVRYADSCGYHSDVDQPITPYRDYVIAAFNDNLPFDQFTIEQIAGDLLPAATLRQRVASGYNRLNKTTEEGGAQAGEYRAKSAADRVRTTAGVWLAATFGCAECHDHKFDPITTRDFYSLAAFFADIDEQGVYSAGGRAPELRVPTPAQQVQLDELDSRQQSLAASRVAEAEGDQSRREKLDAELRTIDEQRKKLDDAISRSMVTVSTAPRETRILPRGNWLDQSGPVVEPALPAFLVSAPPSGERLSRISLAWWLVCAENPLTARVVVNRLWKLFFGIGLSKSLDDLGSQGEAPVHPELLDWLAVEFRENGWNVKQLVRVLVNSRAYRQSSIPRPELTDRDPQNRLVARQSRWRLEAEFIRDQALATSGLLDLTIGGRSVKPYQPEGYWEFLNFPKRKWVADQGGNQYRRGLYTHWQRTFLHPSLLAFDAPSREECTAERPVSNTPKAALALLNDPTFVEAARVLAARALAQPAADDPTRIAWAWRAATSRSPESAEIAVLLELLAMNRRRFTDDEAAARTLLTVGDAPVPGELPVVELAAWTEVARAIFNVHESVARN